MHYRKLGKTGFEVSEIGVGCRGLVGHDLEGMNRALDIMEELGVNLLDIYSPNPDFRSFMGRAVMNRRDKFILQAHIGTIWKNGEYQYSRRMRDVQKGFIDQLKRLATGHVEIGMIHNLEDPEDLDKVLNGDVYDFASRLKQMGTIGALGASTHDVQTALLAAKSGAFDTLMISANPYIDHLDEDGNLTSTLDPVRKEFYDVCAEKEIGLTIMSVFNGGDLLVREAEPEGKMLSEDQCLAYALNIPGVSSAICSALNADELRAACAYSDNPDKDGAYLKALEAFYI